MNRLRRRSYETGRVLSSRSEKSEHEKELAVSDRVAICLHLVIDRKRASKTHARVPSKPVRQGDLFRDVHQSGPGSR